MREREKADGASDVDNMHTHTHTHDDNDRINNKRGIVWMLYEKNREREQERERKCDQTTTRITTTERVNTW